MLVFSYFCEIFVLVCRPAYFKHHTYLVKFIRECIRELNQFIQRVSRDNDATINLMKITKMTGRLPFICKLSVNLKNTTI